MPDERGDELQKHNNEGQTDASKGEYDPPHSINPLDEILYSQELNKEMNEDNKSYNKGWSHGYKQR